MDKTNLTDANLISVEVAISTLRHNLDKLEEKVENKSITQKYLLQAIKENHLMTNRLFDIAFDNDEESNNE